MQNYSLTFPTYFRVAQISLRHHNSVPYMIAQDGGNSQGFFVFVPMLVCQIWMGGRTTTPVREF